MKEPASFLSIRRCSRAFNHVQHRDRI